MGRKEVQEGDDICMLAMLNCLVMSNSVMPWTAAHQAPLSMEILRARILEWVAMPSSRGSSQGLNPGLLHCRQILYQLSYQESPNICIHIAYSLNCMAETDATS